MVVAEHGGLELAVNGYRFLLPTISFALFFRCEVDGVLVVLLLGQTKQGRKKGSVLPAHGVTGTTRGVKQLLKCTDTMSGPAPRIIANQTEKATMMSPPRNTIAAIDTRRNIGAADGTFLHRNSDNTTCCSSSPNTRSLLLMLGVVVGSSLWCALPHKSLLAAQQPASEEQSQFDMGIGGCGGVYFLASPGELTIELYKRDRHRHSRKTQLRAILVGPDRQVLGEAVIPDDGKPRGSGLGPVQQARLSVHVAHKGVYALNITVSQDRYGDEIVWGFRTNCSKYLIETSRGHRDARHEEPIVLLGPDRPGNVCFVPSRRAFRIEVTGLPASVKQLPLYDADGKRVRTLQVNEQGEATQVIAKDAHRADKPWRLQFASQQATIQIDGVTRWNSNDRYSNLSLWTTDLNAFFPLAQYRWLLTPYHRKVYGVAGTQRQVEFQVHNNSRHPANIQLQVETDRDTHSARLSANSVDVPPQRSVPVSLTFTISKDEARQVYRVRATPRECPDFTTYSTLTVVAGTAPADRPVPIPIVLKPYEHENEQFGYLPTYPVGNQMYFDLANRPFTRSGNGIATLGDNGWRTTDVRNTEVRTGTANGRSSRATISIASTKIAFDADNDIYVLGRAGRTAMLLYSSDGGRSFSAYAIPGREGAPCAFDIEQFSGHNVPDGPPPIVRYTRTASDPKLFWRRINDLELFLPKKVDGHLTIGKPILLSRLCIGLASHSGIPSSIVSRGSKVHVIWGEATEPAVKVPGVPTYVVTYDRETAKLGKPALVGYGPPANDIHNSPSITIDSHGYLHTLAGTHGHPFPYARSLKPNDSGSGWTEPELVGTGRQTYIGFVCGADDSLHLVFRMWRQNTEPHPLSIHATLAYQRKLPGKPWEAPRVLIVSPFSEYSVFYHRLTIDRIGRLFLSYDYWSTYWFYRTDHRGDRRALLLSPDRGTSWKLVETEDFAKPPE